MNFTEKQLKKIQDNSFYNSNPLQIEINLYEKGLLSKQEINNVISRHKFITQKPIDIINELFKDCFTLASIQSQLNFLKTSRI